MTVAAQSFDVDVRAGALLNQLHSLQKVTVNSGDLDAWLYQLSQLEREVQTLWITRILAVKRNANDEDAKTQYKRLVSHWIPQIETQIDALHELACAWNLAESHPDVALRFEVDRLKKQSREQLALEAQERVLITEYDTIAGNKSVIFEGRHLRIQEVEALLRSTTDRHQREALWKLIKSSELEVAPKLDALFARLLELRQNLAAVSGHANYVEHVWASSDRLYTPDEAVEFLNSTAEIFADLNTRLDQSRANALGIEQLRPWDSNVRLSPPSDKVLSDDDYLDLSKQIIDNIAPEFGALVDKLRQEGRFDLSPRLGKMNGNAAFLHRALNTTEIVCNLTGAFGDVSALLHELGHAIHWHFLTPHNFAWDLNVGQEISEFGAFVFQFLGCEIISQNDTLSKSDRDWYRRSAIQNILARLRSVDERVRMELWLYSQTSEIASSKIDQHYLVLYQRPAMDWAGHEDYLAKQWQHEHLFTYSFYNIEYSIATVAALLFLDLYHENPSQAVEGLKVAMAMGSAQGFKANFAAMGIHFPFQREQIVAARNVLVSWLD
jgi:oligoendopeptidase F